MINKLDKLVIKAFVGPFIATFFITLFVLLMQFFWLWIDDFVGKGLDNSVILTFIWYTLPELMQLALPLAVLLSSLMTFGNLGESFELVAIKSAGISLLRFMRPLGALVLLICGLAFLLANNLVPVAKLKSKTMLSDIVHAKPAFDLKEGVFYDKIPGIAIKIGKKEENDTVVRDVIIFEENSGGLQDNFIIAQSATMTVSENKRFLQFNLKNGWRYQERGNRGDINTEYIRLNFSSYKKDIDLTAVNKKNWTDEDVNKSLEQMLSIRQLGKGIDSLQGEIQKSEKKFRNDIFMSARFAQYLDTGWKREDIKKDSLIPEPLKSFDELVPDSFRTTVFQQATSVLSQAKTNTDMGMSELGSKSQSLRKHKIEWHRKIALPLACFVLFLIGAPLGSIIRKGGLGMPLVISIVFFILFFFTGRIGEQLAKTGKMTALTGMWFANMVLLPIGIFLTYKAMRDSQLFSNEFYFRTFRKIKPFLQPLIRFFSRKKKSSPTA